ncbi:MAG: hypothetical protein AB7G25_09150 [Sphingomonadaceae bacterium]
MKPFSDHRAAAMAILTSGGQLRPREGQFLGGLAFDANPLSEKQDNWLRILLDKHGLPPLEGGVA